MIRKLLILPFFLLFFIACHQVINTTLPKIKNERVLFIGEYHDNYAHHINQKNIIQDLHEKGFNIAIGMEMFQRPFQQVLDDYICGKIDEKTMLQKSEYFTRWGYDYTLYQPIMLVAKENHIPVIALNLEKEITKKISKKGLESLTKEEKNKLPKSLDFSDSAYKERLVKVFNDPEHLAAMPKKYHLNPDFLYQSQILWDETMAETIANYLKSHPQTLMIVLAGNGHLAYFVGIPNRVKRRLPLPMRVILQDSEKEKGKADQYLFPEAIMIEQTPKLGVLLSPKGLKVIEVIKDSLADNIGIKEDDTLIAFSKIPIHNLADLKLALYLYRNKKDWTVSVKRGSKKVILK